MRKNTKLGMGLVTAGAATATAASGISGTLPATAFTTAMLAGAATGLGIVVLVVDWAYNGQRAELYDTASSAPRQRYIDTGRHLRRGEAEHGGE